jgi:hypothetical protein
MLNSLDIPSMAFIQGEFREFMLVMTYVFAVRLKAEAANY